MSGFESVFHLGAQGHGEELSWTPEQRQEIERILARYPTKKAAIMPLLWMAQKHWGWLSLEVMQLVARTLDLPPSHVLAVATFYTMYKKAPTGKHLIQVCHTLSCALAGAERIIAHIEKRLGIRAGETTEDGLFTLVRVECLAACGSGPMCQVDDDYYELLTEEKVDEILDALREGRPLQLPRPEVDQWTYSRAS